MFDRYTPPTFEQIIKRASAMLLADGFHAPMVFAIGSKNTSITMIAEMPAMGEERQRALYVLGYEVSRHAIGTLLAVIMVMESWYSLAGPDGEMLVHPSDDPNRMEMLMLSHYHVRQRRLDVVALQMLRDSDGRLVDLLTYADTRKSEAEPESALMEAFMDGYHAGRKGRIPPTSGRRG